MVMEEKIKNKRIGLVEMKMESTLHLLPFSARGTFHKISKSKHPCKINDLVMCSVDNMFSDFFKQYCL
jgi:hypothetical protein